MGLPLQLVARERAKFAPPPEGVDPNFENPDSNGDMYMEGALTTLGIAFVCLCIRLGTKLRGSGNRLRWDDALIVFAFILSIARTACFAVDIYHYGIAHHIWDLPLPLHRNTWLLHRIADIFWPPAILCAKLSILLTYIQIFGHYRKFKWICYGLMGFNTAYLGATTLVHIFWCDPVGAAYGLHSSDVVPVCIDGYKTNLATGALNLLTDIIILILPMPMLYKLQLSKGKKFAVAGVFSVGALTVATTIVREVEIATKLQGSEADQTWVVMYEAVWISVELNIAITAACLLFCQQFFRYALLESKLGYSLQSLLRSRGSNSSRDRAYGVTGFSSQPEYDEHGSKVSIRGGGNRDMEMSGHTKTSRDGKLSEDDVSMPEAPEGAILQTRSFRAV